MWHFRKIADISQFACQKHKGSEMHTFIYKEASIFSQLQSNRQGATVIELYLIDRMGHGTPVRRTKAQARAGGAGPFMLDVGISSSLHLAKSWGLVRRKTASRQT